MNEIVKLITPFVASFSALMGVALTIFMQSLISKRNQSFELQKESIKLIHDDNEKRLWLIRERLEKLHLIVGEISREFSLTFLTIDWEVKIRRSDYHEKYRSLCIKHEEIQMISDLYVQELSEDISMLGGDMNCYWGSFAQLLYLEENGEKIDINSQCYQESFKFSHSILKKAELIKQKIREISHKIMDKENNVLN